MGEVLVDVVIFVDDAVGAGSASGSGGGAQLGAGDEAEAGRAGGTRLTSVPLTGAYQPGNFNALPVRPCDMQAASSTRGESPLARRVWQQMQEREPGLINWGGAEIEVSASSR